MANKKLNRSQSAHKILIRIYKDKANKAKTGTQNAFYCAKVDYHNTIVNMQRNRQGLIPKKERSRIYSEMLKRRGVN